jgi:hypothetical protein
MRYFYGAENGMKDNISKAMEKLRLKGTPCNVNGGYS